MRDVIKEDNRNNMNKLKKKDLLLLKDLKSGYVKQSSPITGLGGL
jgi:hypothetical protein